MVSDVAEERGFLMFGDELLGGLGDGTFVFSACGGGRAGVFRKERCDVESLFGWSESFATEVPFAEHSGGVTIFSKELGQGLFFERELPFDDRLNELLRRSVGPAREVVGEVKASGVFAGQDGGSRGRANGLGDVGAREANPVFGKLIEMGCVVVEPAVGVQVTNTQIVGENQQDVGWSGGCVEVGGKESACGQCHLKKSKAHGEDVP